MSATLSCFPPRQAMRHKLIVLGIHSGGTKDNIDQFDFKAGNGGKRC